MNREDKQVRAVATACMNLELIVDTMTSAVMDMLQEAKKLGIYKQERKKRLNALMNEMKLLANSLDRRAGEDIGMVADYNEAYSEQLMPYRTKALEETCKVIEKTGIPNPTYLVAPSPRDRHCNLYRYRHLGQTHHRSLQSATQSVFVRTLPS